MIDIQGHRGCRGLYPENTLIGFQKALEIGVTTLEMDLVITKDNKVIVSHEPFFNHEISTKPDGTFINEENEKSFNIYKMTFEESQLFDVGLKPHPRFEKQVKIAAKKPLLSEVVDMVEKFDRTNMSPIKYNIEIKRTKEGDTIFHPDYKLFADLVVEVIEAKKITSRTTVQCFDHETLIYLKKHYPHLTLSLLVEDKRSIQDHLKILGFSPQVYSPNHTLVDEHLVKFCKEQNIMLLPWTVNESEEVKRLQTLGVDGIISDYPDMLIKVLRN